MRKIDITAIALHAAAFAIWPFAVGYTVFKLLSERYPVRRV